MSEIFNAGPPPFIIKHRRFLGASPEQSVQKDTCNAAYNFSVTVLYLSLYTGT